MERFFLEASTKTHVRKPYMKRYFLEASTVTHVRKPYLERYFLETSTETHSGQKAIFGKILFLGFY